MTRQREQSSFLFAFFTVFLISSSEVSGQVDYSIRLEGSVSKKEGRVEVFSQGSWGTICDDRWDNDDATVVCRQLGFLGPAIAKVEAFFGEGSGDIVLDDVECTGTETNIGQCQTSTAHNCGHSEDAGVICSDLVEDVEGTRAWGTMEYSIRLEGGSSDREGRVEVYYKDSWGTICDDEWDNSDATVVCRQLGFLGPAIARGAAYFGSGTGDIVLDNVECLGTETNLAQCPAFLEHNCGHPEDAGVTCSDGNEVGSFAVRLEGGSSHLEGRVEVFYQGAWGTVCDDSWDDEDARVVCRQLGFQGPAAARLSGHFGAGVGIIVLDNVRCAGTEFTLSQCDADVNDHNCAHTEDAGVSCSVMGDSIGDYTIRLKGGATEYEGRVEVFLNGAWGTVCDDDWDLRDAKVVCKQLGFLSAMYARTSAWFGEGTGEILLDNVGCYGTELNLRYCTASTQHNCAHNEDAGVVCLDEDGNFQDSHGQVRLVGGPTDNVGSVEVYYNGQWGTICDDEWNLADADVVCYQLGFKGAEAFRTEAYYRSGSGYIAITDVSCSGTEAKITDCPHNSSPLCFHSEDAGVDCVRPNENDIRLVGGNSQGEGRLEVFISDRWGAVCDAAWDKKDAEVVCRELGFSGVESANYDGNFGSSAPFVFYSISCSGSEERIAYCYSVSYSEGLCSQDDAVAVKCTESMSGGTIAGITFGVIVGILLLCICCWCCCRSSEKQEATTTVTAAAPVSNGERTAGGYTPVAQGPTEVIHPPAAYYSPAQNTVNLNPSGEYEEPPPPTYNDVIAQPSAYPVTSSNAYPISPTAPPLYPSQGYPAPSQGPPAYPLPSEVQMPYPPSVQQHPPPVQQYPPPTHQDPPPTLQDPPPTHQDPPPSDSGASAPSIA